MIKVNLSSGQHSAGRGVGFYAQFLGEALEKTGQIELTSDNPDIIHYPFFDLFYPTLPLKKEKPTVVTIHDLTPLVLSSKYPKGIKGSLSLLRQRLSLMSVKAIITDSENSRQDIIKLFQIPESKVFVTPLAVDPGYQKPVSKSDLEEVKKKYQLPEKFVLCVAAGPNPNKNLPLLAQVTKEIGIPLVIVGKGMLQEVKEPIHAELKDLVVLKQFKHVLLPGFVPTPDLNCMYKLASLYCQPSLYEGFGLPLLEAMSAGCIVASSDVSSLPEIYHSSAITFDPTSKSSMALAINKVLELPAKEKQKQIEDAIKRSNEFTWEKTAKMTIDIYKKINEA